MHQNLNPRRFLTSLQDAQELEKTQRGIVRQAEKMNIKLAELDGKQRVINKGTLDIGIFDVTSPSTFENVWSNIE